jgi:hypothetical protein
MSDTASGETRSGRASRVHRRRYGLITGPQLAMLARMDDGPEDDSVGLEAEALSAPQIAVCERLVGRDLARFDVGWRYSCWFRLTPAGRAALRELAAAAGPARAFPTTFSI